MAIKILIHRKVRPGKEKELSEAVRNLRSKTIHAEGYICGETLHSIEDPSLYLVISTWRSLEDWNRWANSPQRKEFQQMTDAMLEEPAKSLHTSMNRPLSMSRRYLPVFPVCRMSEDHRVPVAGRCLNGADA